MNKKNKNLIWYTIIILGLIKITLNILNFVIERETFYETTHLLLVGIIFVFLGIYELINKNTNYAKWKEIPLIFKIIIIYSGFITIRFFLNASTKMQEINSFFGIIIMPPTSIFLNLIYFLIPLLLIFSIFQKKWRKPMMFLLIFTIINGIMGLITLLQLPLAELTELTGEELPKIPQEELEQLHGFLKITMGVMMSIPVIIYAIMTMCFYKNKKYFEKPNLN